MSDLRNAWERFSSEEKLVTACGLLTMILCVLPWYSMRVPMFDARMTSSGLNSLWGTLVFFCALISAGGLIGMRLEILTLSPQIGRRLPLLASALGALFVLAYVLAGPSGNIEVAAEGSEMSVGKTLVPWMALIAMGTATYVAYQRFTAGQEASSEQPGDAPPPADPGAQDPDRPGIF